MIVSGMHSSYLSHYIMSCHIIIYLSVSLHGLFLIYVLLLLQSIRAILRSKLLGESVVTIFRITSALPVPLLFLSLPLFLNQNSKVWMKTPFGQWHKSLFKCFFLQQSVYEAVLCISICVAESCCVFTQICFHTGKPSFCSVYVLSTAMILPSFSFTLQSLWQEKCYDLHHLCLLNEVFHSWSLRDSITL